MSWNERFMPYPVLTPSNDDYNNPRFELLVNEPVRAGGVLTIPFKLEVSSASLKKLISKSKAQYVIQTSCIRTVARDTHRTFLDTDTFELLDGDYSDALVLTPYILAVEEIPSFKSDEHAREWRDYHPEGFDIEEAGILAVGNDVEITLASDSIGSVIDLVAMPQAEGMFSVELDGEHIVISVSGEDKQRIDAMRRRSERDITHASLFPSLYLHAITSALQSVFDYEDRRWARTILNQLEDKGIQADRETIAAQSLHYAQLLMEQPLAKHLDAAFATETDL